MAGSDKDNDTYHDPSIADGVLFFERILHILGDVVHLVYGGYASLIEKPPDLRRRIRLDSRYRADFILNC